jgi:hypothetical protein
MMQYCVFNAAISINLMLFPLVLIPSVFASSETHASYNVTNPSDQATQSSKGDIKGISQMDKTVQEFLANDPRLAKASAFFNAVKEKLPSDFTLLAPVDDNLKDYDALFSVIQSIPPMAKLAVLSQMYSARLWVDKAKGLVSQKAGDLKSLAGMNLNPALASKIRDKVVEMYELKDGNLFIVKDPILT